MTIKIRQLDSGDKSGAIALVSSGGLITENILDDGTKYWGAFNEEELVGVIGCECQGECALLRSAIVDGRYRNMGIAKKLTDVLISNAKSDGVKTIYLFTTDAGGYWEKLGFTETPVGEIIGKLTNAPQVRLLDSLGWLPTEIVYKYDL